MQCGREGYSEAVAGNAFSLPRDELNIDALRHKLKGTSQHPINSVITHTVQVMDSEIKLNNN